jgi:hypothetical protein
MDETTPHELPSKDHPLSPGLVSVARALEVGLERPATVFLSYAHEDTQAVKQLQLQLNLRGVRAWRDVTDLLLGAATRQEIAQAIEREADALALYITPAYLASEFIWEVEVPAALRRIEREPGFFLVPILQGLSFHDLRQFCAERKLPDLSEFNGVLLPGVSSEASQGMVSGEHVLGEIARRLLKAALALRLRRVQAERDYEPWLCVKTFAYEPPAASLDLDVNWIELVSEKNRLPTPEEWEHLLRPALLDVKQAISEKIPSRRLHLCVQSILPVAFALGFTFPESAHFTLFLEGRHGTWSTAEKPRRTAPLRCVSSPNGEGDSRVGVVELAISRLTERAVAEALPLLGLAPGQHLRFELPQGSSQEGVKDAVHALAMARQIGRACRELYDQQGVTQIHLFAALPAALGVLVGHYLSALCPITLYEFSPARGYQLVGTLH